LGWDGIDLQRLVQGQTNSAGFRAMAIREPIFKVAESSRCSFRPRLVYGMDIPLGKWIVITGNEEEWNGIIIQIP
jgi:hypothetical protein